MSEGFKLPEEVREEKFTPGPWQVTWNHKIFNGGGGYGWEAPAAYSNYEHDALLMAASPDLYEACKALVEGRINIEIVKEMARIAVDKVKAK